MQLTQDVRTVISFAAYGEIRKVVHRVEGVNDGQVRISGTGPLNL